MSLIECLAYYTQIVKNQSKVQARICLEDMDVHPIVIDEIEVMVNDQGQWLRSDGSVYPVSSTAE